MFINRQGELQLLEERYASDQAELFVLYGRRRVGKTELLAQFCQDKRHIFFVADLNAEPVLRAALSTIVNAELLGPEAARAIYPSWQDIFLLLAHHAQKERLAILTPPEKHGIALARLFYNKRIQDHCPPRFQGPFRGQAARRGAGLAHRFLL